ncbi:phytoene desaturase family protein [Rhodococcus sp. X156]|uniref:phytoene desaturase family protein n=1 Tax=Rhodococcus sp. X156 TaxID=2499145 RepID=UPI000FD977F8|nr:phytoene desaturase family protein [Rhodococcus sp. X156]
MRTVAGPTDHVVVVGAGLAGLSAALHLLGAGRAVTLLERDDLPGGRMGRLDVDGYRIDTGPTVLTMPELIDDALSAVGASLHDTVRLHRLDPAYRARYADGTTLDVHTDPDAMEAEVRAKMGAADAAGYRRLRTWLTAMYDAEIDRFIGGNFDSPLDMVSSRAALADLSRFTRLGGLASLAGKVGAHVTDERLRRIFTFQALYAGVAPQRARAAYGVISYMDTVAGVYFPEGGMHAVAQAMADAAVTGGAKLQLGTEVAELEHDGDRVSAVRTAAGERIACDAVVLTPDLPLVDELLGRPHRRRLPTRWAPSAVVLHGGVSREVTAGWPEAAHHTIDFGAAWKQTFTEIIAGGRPGRGRLMSDPSLLVTRPSLTDPTLAPDGQELCYILAPCPNLRTAPLDWDTLGPAYRDELLGVLEARGYTGIAEHLTVHELVTPAGWAAQGMAAGTPFSAAHTVAQTGPFRRGNLVPGLDNAVLAGCGTTPGVGVPTTVISGRLAAQRVTG